MATNGSQLLEQLEQELRAAYARGWADCYAAMQDALSGLSAPHGDQPRKSQTAQPRRNSSSAMQLPRGVSTNLIEEILGSAAPRALSQLQIIQTAEARDGTKLAYSSMRRVLDRLVREGKIEQVQGTKTWRHLHRQVIGGGDPGGEAPGSLELAAE